MDIRYLLCHICGEQNWNLPYWAQVPMSSPGIISIGKEVDITTAIEYFGETCIIAGNIEPAILQTGAPEEIYELCRHLLRKVNWLPAVMP